VPVAVVDLVVLGMNLIPGYAHSVEEMVFAQGYDDAAALDIASFALDVG